jgi:hypothetical protein
MSLYEPETNNCIVYISQFREGVDTPVGIRAGPRRAAEPLDVEIGRVNVSAPFAVESDPSSVVFHSFHS